MRRPLSTIAAAALALTMAQGCHTYSQVGTPQEAAARANAGPMEVTRTDHSVLRLNRVAIVGDSLICVTDDSGEMRVAVATADIQNVAVREVSAGRSLALGAGVTVVTLAVLLLVAVSSFAGVP